MKIDNAFLALAHPIRRQIIEKLEGSEKNVGEVSDHFKSVTRQAVHKHLRILEQAGFIHSNRTGRDVHLSLRRNPILEVEQWIERRQAYWEKRLLNLKKFVEEESGDSL